MYDSNLKSGWEKEFFPWRNSSALHSVP